MKVNQGDEAGTLIVFFLQFATLDAEVLGSSMKNIVDCDDIYRQMTEIHIVNSSFEKGLLKVRGCLETNCSVLFRPA